MTGSALRTVLRILVVDDNDDACELVRYILEAAGHEVTCASRGGDALDLLRNDTFDAALVDLALPDVDGYAVARGARVLRGQTLRLVLATGFASEEHRDEAVRAGFDVYLVKPFERSAVIAALTGGGSG